METKWNLAATDAEATARLSNQESKRFESGKQERRISFFSCFPVFLIQGLFPGFVGSRFSVNPLRKRGSERLWTHSKSAIWKPGTQEI
jgi:hypothetical protein